MRERSKVARQRRGVVDEIFPIEYRSPRRFRMLAQRRRRRSSAAQKVVASVAVALKLLMP